MFGESFLFLFLARGILILFRYLDGLDLAFLDRDLDFVAHVHSVKIDNVLYLTHLGCSILQFQSHGKPLYDPGDRLLRERRASQRNKKRCGAKTRRKFVHE